MKRWLRRAGAIVVLALLGLFIVLLIEHFRGQWALRRRLRALQASSERLNTSSLISRRPSVDQNAFIELMGLTNRLAALNAAIEKAPPSLRFGAPGRALLLAQTRGSRGESNKLGDWSSVVPALDQSRDALNLVHSALQKPAYDSGFNYEKGFVDFQIGPIAAVMRVAKALSGAALCELRTQRDAEAYPDAVALVRLTAHQTPEPLVIAQLVRIACVAVAFNTTWQALHTRRWTDAELSTLQAAWAECHLVEDMARAFEVERALTLDYFEQLKHSRAKLQHVLAEQKRANAMLDGSEPGEPKLTDNSLITAVYLPVWQLAWASQDEHRALDRWQRVVERERFARTNSWIDLANRPPIEEDSAKAGWYDRLRFLLSREPFSISDTAIRQTFQAQTQQQMTITALAIERYRLKHGKLPSTLIDLLPEFLRDLPRDWMDGKPLRYRTLDDHQFLLYSVGEDGHDDGGKPEPAKTTKEFRRLWDGQDALWPLVATQEEAAAPVQKSTGP